MTIGSPNGVTLDVRPMLAEGVEPFDAIMEAAKSVTAGGTLTLTAPFEPVPLYHVLAKRGFTHALERRGPGEYVVSFTREGGLLDSPAVGRDSAAQSGGPDAITIDHTVGEVHRRFPATASVLDRYGIDLCCGASKTLAFAARAHGADPEQLLKDLRVAAARTS